MTSRNDLADYELKELLAEVRRRLDLAPAAPPAPPAAVNSPLPGYEPPETAATRGPEPPWFAAVRRR